MAGDFKIIGEKHAFVVRETHDLFFALARSSKYYAPDLNIPDLTRLFEWLVAGRISVPIKGVFKLQDIKNAHRE